MLVEELAAILVPTPGTILRKLVAHRRGSPVPAARMGRLLAFERERQLREREAPRVAVAISPDGTPAKPQQLAVGSWRLARRVVSSDSERGRAAYIGAHLCRRALDHPVLGEALQPDALALARAIGVQIDGGPHDAEDWSELNAAFIAAQPLAGPESLSPEQHRAEDALEASGLSPTALFFGSEGPAGSSGSLDLQLALVPDEGEPFDELVRRRAGPERARETLAFLQEWGTLCDELGRPPTVDDYATRWATTAAEARRRTTAFGEVVPEGSPDAIWRLLNEGGSGAEERPAFARIVSRRVLAGAEPPQLAGYFLSSLERQLSDALAKRLRDARLVPLAEPAGAALEATRLFALADCAFNEWVPRALRSLGIQAENEVRDLEEIGLLSSPHAAKLAAERLGSCWRRQREPRVREALSRTQRLTRLCAELDLANPPDGVAPLLPGASLGAAALAASAETGALDVVAAARTALNLLSADDPWRARRPTAPRAVTRSPEWVDATALDQLSDRLEARDLLPELIRRLLAASPNVTWWEMRAGVGIGDPGYDGRVEASFGDAWIPPGQSVWELSTATDVGGKARRDLRKRIEDPAVADPNTATFVFVTSRIWRGGHEAARRWLEEGPWKEIRVIDAETLAAWLQEYPGVHLWISERLGMHPQRARTLADWWARLAARTQPAIPAALLLAGREGEAAELRRKIEAPESTTAVRARSREEAIAFVAAALGADDRRRVVPGEPVIVTDPEVFERLISQPGHGLLIVAFDAPEAPLAAGGHPVVVTLGAGHPQRPESIQLPRVSRTAAADALRDAGLSFNRAEALAVVARRSFTALQRRMSPLPNTAMPDWAREKPATVAALATVGTWTEGDADMSIAAEIAALSAAELESELKRLTTVEDPPFIESGGRWLTISPEDLWEMVGRALDRPALGRWQAAALRVLGEQDPVLDLPPEERAMAGLRGVRREFSETLRNGLARSAALLGARGDHPLSEEEVHAGARVRELVHELLDLPSSEQLYRRWCALSSLLPALAEGAPEQFLDVLERDLRQEAPALAATLDDREADPLFSSSPHTGLLWALEVLAWSPDHLTRVALALGRLAELDPPEARLANRPASSLRDILLPWLPQTTASVEQRCEAIDALRMRHPDVAWRLCLDLLPTFGGSSSGTRPPLFRDWQREGEQPDQEEWWGMVEASTARVLADVEREPGRFPAAVEHLAGLTRAGREQLLGMLGGLDAATLTDEDRQALWRKLLDEAGRHGSFPEAEWALPREIVIRMREIADRLEDRSSPARYARLFDWHPDLPDVDREDLPAYDAAVDEARGVAVREVHERHGDTGLLALVEASPLPGYVGKAVAEVAGDAAREVAFECLGAEGRRGEFVRGWIAAMERRFGTSWVELALQEVRALDPEAQADFVLALKATPATWELLGRLGPEAAEHYWRRLNPHLIDGAGATRAAEEFLAREELWRALEVLAFALHQKVSPPVKLVERALWMPIERPDLDPRQVRAADVGELLDYLGAEEADADDLARLEWQYYGLLRNQRTPRALVAAMTSSPELFVQLVEIVYRADEEEPEGSGDSEEAPDPAMASQAWSVLHQVRAFPGQDESGGVDATELRGWVSRARELLAASGRREIGDQTIGQLLARGPAGGDGVWPCEPVRDLLEELDSEQFAIGMRIGRYNQRGPTMRAVYAGGEQEHELAQRYAAEATTLQPRWPAAAALLRDLAQSYEHDARRHDEEAERRQDAN